MTTETPNLIGFCENPDHGLLAHSSSAFLIMGVLAHHRETEKCNAKSWVESHDQYLDRIERKRILEEIARKHEEAFKSKKLRVEG